MHLPNIAPLKLGYTGTDPEDGRAYSSELWVYEKSGTIVIESVSDGESEIIGELAASAKIDWRSIIETIEWSHVGAYLIPDDIDPADHSLAQNIIVEGAENYASELIALAWIDPEHKKIAIALAEASDEQLSALRGKVGSFRSQSFVQQMMELSESARQTRIPLKTFVRRVRSAPLEVPAMQRDADALTEIIRAEAQAKHAHYEWNIGSFKEEIEQSVRSWWKINANVRQPDGVNAGAVRNYVVQWVTDHQCLPSDKHRIAYTMVSRRGEDEVEHKGDFEVDFDLLFIRE